MRPVILLCIMAVGAADASRWTKEYDDCFRRAARRHWDAALDWNILKAQAITESALKPRAVSPVGAKGIGQFLDGTWRETQAAYPGPGRLGGVFNPCDNIHGQSYYMRKLYNQWTSPRPWHDRISLALISYNAGLGNILDAQKAAGGALLVRPVLDSLCTVTGHHCVETQNYFTRIWNYYKRLTSESRKGQNRLALSLVSQAEASVVDDVKDAIGKAKEVAQEVEQAKDTVQQVKQIATTLGIPNSIWRNFAVSFGHFIPGILLGMGILYFGFKLLDRLTNYDTSDEVKNMNICAAFVVVGKLAAMCYIIGKFIEAAMH